MRLVQNCSNEGRLEASHVINEKYQAVDDKMKQLQNAFLQEKLEAVTDKVKSRLNAILQATTK